MPSAWLLAWFLAAARADSHRSEAAPSPIVLGRLDRIVLALSPAGPDHLLFVEEDRISLWRVSGGTLVPSGSVPAPEPAERVRDAAALVHAPADDGGWVLRTGWTGAVLVSLEGRADAAKGATLAITSAADALPWPGAGKGVRFRSGTSLIEGPLAGMGDGPYVMIAPDGTAAVDRDGRLLLSDDETSDAVPRVGSAVVRPWPGLVVASSAVPPGPNDEVLLIRTDPPRVIGRVAVDGRIRALAVWTAGATGSVFAAVERERGTDIVRIDIRRPAGPK
jgi:hypothetical protein